MQIGVEYLAYKIYQLYPSNAPEGIEIVSDSSQKRIGLATREAKGVPGRGIDFRKWVDSISGGAMVDIFLANWDVRNTNNFVVDPVTNIASRVDPGGALTFRAQGQRKGPRFSPQAGELETMLDPNMRGGAGFLLFKWMPAKQPLRFCLLNGLKFNKQSMKLIKMLRTD